MLNKPHGLKALMFLKLVVQKVIQVQQTEGFDKPRQTNPAKMQALLKGSVPRRVTTLADAAGGNPGKTRLLPSTGASWPQWPQHGPGRMLQADLP